MKTSNSLFLSSSARHSRGSNGWGEKGAFSRPMSHSIKTWSSAFSYDPQTGEFRFKTLPIEAFSSKRAWRIACSKTFGKKAGTTNAAGYVVLTLAKQRCYAHRLAIALETGEWPSAEVDHINGNQSDNRRENLRPATRQENAANIRLRADNKSGTTGVRWNQRERKWKAQITKSGVVVFLGTFDTPEAAIKSRRETEVRLHGEFSPTVCR